MEQIAFREMKAGEEEQVCALVRHIFDELVAPDYRQEGVDEFFKFANASAMKARYAEGGFVLVASDREKLVGMLEFVPPDRIALLFVALRGHGIARELINLVIGRLKGSRIPVTTLTVHSSPHAEPVYRKLGFHRTGAVTIDHGMNYVPMARELESAESLC